MRDERRQMHYPAAARSGRRSVLTREISMKLGWKPRKWLDKKSKLGFRGYPVGTIAFYGPDDQRASKVAVAVIAAPDTEPVALRRWFAESGDVRNDAAIFEEIGLFLRDHEVHSVAMTEEMLGCPHEEGIDYPEGDACPDCPFWAGRDRPLGL
jgi:hypothetical protein